MDKKANNIKEDMNLILNLLKQNKLLSSVGVFFSFLYSCIITAMPLISKYLIDVVLTTNNKNQVYIGIGIFFGVCILQPIFFSCKEVIFTNLAEKLSRSMRIKMYTKLSKLPLTSFDRLNYGTVSTKILSDTNEVSKYINFGLNNLLTNIIMSILLIIFMFLQNVLISAIIITVFVIYFILNKLISTKYKKISAESLKINENTSNAIKQNYDKILLTKLYVNKENADSKIFKNFNEIKRINVKSYNFNNILNGVTLGIMALVLSLIYGIGALFILNNKMTLGTVIALGLFFQSLVPSLNSLIMNNINFNRVKPSVKRIKAYMDEPEEKGNVKDIGEPSVVFENVSFRYNLETPVLEDINIEIKNPGVYAFIGSSGSGKSTIGKLILGLYNVIEGKVYVFNRNTAEIDKDILRKNISYVSQDVELLNDTIYNNIILGNKNARFEDVKRITELLNLDNVIESLPEKYDTVITEKVNLSGGEKKRIALCRAYLKQASIYIFDEPEASLSIDTYKVLSDIYTELSKNNIVIVITHHTSSLPKCNKIFNIEGGRIINE